MMIHKQFGCLLGLAAGFAAICAGGQTNDAAAGTNAVNAAGAAGNTNVVARGRRDIGGKLGDPAPPLTVQEWIKGRPFRIAPGTNVFVLVFCSLSRANEVALTNLTALQRTYGDKGVLVAAISSESPQELKDFVTTHGGDIDFSVAADDLAQKTATDYQRLFRQMLLPRAYIVGTNGAVLWHGHPLRDDMGMVVDKITSGRYDMKEVNKKVVANEQMEVYNELARQDDPRAPRVGRLMLMLRTNDAPGLCSLAFQIATAPFVEKRDVALATAALDRAAQISTTNTTDIAISRSLLLFQSGLQEAGIAKAKEALAATTNAADQKVIQGNIRSMEKLMEIAKTNNPAGATNPVGGTNAAPKK